MTSFLHGKHCAVIGLGLSGIAACRLLAERGAEVIGVDDKPRSAASPDLLALEKAGVVLWLASEGSLPYTELDLVVVSPGVPPTSRWLADAAKGRVKVWSEIELAVRAAEESADQGERKRPRLVAIGGTNGKSTVTSLVGALLERAGKRTFIGGNLGEPLAAHASEPFDAIVLEVSSFQLERLEQFHPHVSVLLNVTPDHLDRYDDFDGYAAAKGNAFVRQTRADVAVVPVGDEICARQARRGEGRVVTFGPGGDVDVRKDAIVTQSPPHSFARANIGLQGGHNALNVAAALAAVVAPFGLDVRVVEEVLERFRGLPHRMVLVRDHRGVRWYDDSKGTNVGASVTAVRGIAEQRVVLVAGGKDKGGSYEPLVEALREKGRAAVLIGEATSLIADAIGDAVPVERASSMEDAVARAGRLAQPGDAVLLSPACSSFDMFRDYKERGDAFVAAVHALTDRAEATS